MKANITPGEQALARLVQACLSHSGHSTFPIAQLIVHLYNSEYTQVDIGRLCQRVDREHFVDVLAVLAWYRGGRPPGLPSRIPRRWSAQDSRAHVSLRHWAARGFGTSRRERPGHRGSVVWAPALGNSKRQSHARQACLAGRFLSKPPHQLALNSSDRVCRRSCRVVSYGPPSCTRPLAPESCKIALGLHRPCLPALQGQPLAAVNLGNRSAKRVPV